ncbi:MAG: DUF2231 domain-containing protein [Dermatophilaceae bacterium]
MVDTILGLPVHPLIVHGVVVLLPLMALVTVVVAVRPSWRRTMAWPVVVLNALVLGMTVVAKESGEALEKRLGITVSEHESWGSRLPYVAAALLVASVVVAIWRRTARFGPIAVILTLLVAAVTVFWTVRTGHTGATAVWGGIG